MTNDDNKTKKENDDIEYGEESTRSTKMNAINIFLIGNLFIILALCTGIASGYAYTAFKQYFFLPPCTCPLIGDATNPIEEERVRYRESREKAEIMYLEQEEAKKKKWWCKKIWARRPMLRLGQRLNLCTADRREVFERAERERGGEEGGGEKKERKGEKGEVKKKGESGEKKKKGGESNEKKENGGKRREKKEESESEDADDEDDDDDDGKKRKKKKGGAGEKKQNRKYSYNVYDKPNEGER